MKERIGAGIGAFFFVLIFGGVGALGIWAIAGTIRLGLQAEDWVKVQGQLQRWEGGEAAYSYSWGERKYTGTRVGTFVLGGSSDVDDWEDRIDAHLSAALAEKKPVMVMVNPDNPAEALLDNTIRWKLLLFFLPFAIGFTGGGLLAGYMLGSKALGRGESYAGVPLLKPLAREALSMWAIALGWNAVALPIALLAIPEMYARGEWFPVILVSLFLLIGMLILWSALVSTFRALRAGNPFNTAAFR